MNAKTIWIIVAVVFGLALATFIYLYIKNKKPCSCKSALSSNGGGEIVSTKTTTNETTNWDEISNPAMRTKVGTKTVIRNEVCEWDGSNWVNCKRLGTVA